ncbi:MAG: hypothetical protein IH897_01020, partial [Planctomycetes bacterium]|nr:hypothetical protein [Planctomycetota bacterium]
MFWGRSIAAATIFVGVRVASADEIIHQYEGNVHPLDAGWVVGNTCEPPCSEGLADGRFFFFWPNGGPLASYTYWISVTPEEPPPTLWAEWRFRSNHPLGQNFIGCDGGFKVQYRDVVDRVNIYGD